MKRIACFLVAVALLTQGCITVRSIDETGNAVEETRIDLDTTIALTQLALNCAEQAFALWVQWQAQQGQLTESDVAVEAAARQARIDALKALLDQLIAQRNPTPTG